MAMKAVIISLALVGLGLGIHVGFGRAEPPKPIGEKKTEDPKVTATPVDGKRAEPEPIILNGHTCDVWSVSFSPDGKRIVTAGGVITLPNRPTVPGEVKVWDAEKGTEVLTLKGQTDRVTSVCYSPDGKRIAGASSD
jgi:WD40 repeat protein